MSRTRACQVFTLRGGLTFLPKTGAKADPELGMFWWIILWCLTAVMSSFFKANQRPDEPFPVVRNRASRNFSTDLLDEHVKPGTFPLSGSVASGGILEFSSPLAKTGLGSNAMPVRG